MSELTMRGLDPGERERAGPGPFDAQRRHLDALAGAARLRQLSPAAGIDFSSNDYLALAGSPRLGQAAAAALARGVPVGSGGSRLLRGNHAEHELLEEEAARFFQAETALFFGSGFAANATLFSALPQRGDLIVHDELIHASAHDGMRMARCETAGVPHNDATAFADAIAAWRRAGGTGRVWIAVESLYSMDGTRAPLADLAAIAAREDAILLIDEAHATGVFGSDGRGLAAPFEGRENVVTLKTCGKALGCEGALVCGPAVVREFLINRGRGFVFSTAPSPLMAAVVREALRIMVEEPDRRERLVERIAHAQRLLVPLGVRATDSPILPLLLGDAGRAMKAAARLQRRGLDVRAIRPPTVPDGTSRLRLSITLNVAPAEIDRLADLLKEVLP